ncbi:hypothetical protein U1769_23455 [Sphingomonas sp. ZT3P38]|uniref:DUF6429 family protein n=1 Tax=Parasphingomonas zepuensis TaxID=3096161 RepID=UPI002FCA5BA4
MPIDRDKIDEATLALFYIGPHDVCRAWKSFDWDATDRLPAQPGASAAARFMFAPPPGVEVVDQ